MLNYFRYQIHSHEGTTLHAFLLETVSRAHYIKTNVCLLLETAGASLYSVFSSEPYNLSETLVNLDILIEILSCLMTFCGIQNE